MLGLLNRQVNYFLLFFEFCFPLYFIGKSTILQSGNCREEFRFARCVHVVNARS